LRRAESYVASPSPYSSRAPRARLSQGGAFPRIGRVLPYLRTPPARRRARRRLAAPRDSVYRFDAGEQLASRGERRTGPRGRDGVRIVHGDATITARKGIHYRLSARAFSSRRHHRSAESPHGRGKEGEYSGYGHRDPPRRREDPRSGDPDHLRRGDSSGPPREAWAKGNVVVIDSTPRLTARQPLLRQSDPSRPTACRYDEGISLRGGHGFYYRAEGGE